MSVDEWVKARYADDPKGGAAALVAMEKASLLRVRDHDHMIWAPGSDIPQEIMALYEDLNMKPVFGANYRGAAHSRCNSIPPSAPRRRASSTTSRATMATTCSSTHPPSQAKTSVASP